MKISQAGIDAIKGHEALRLFAYLDPVGVPTIGWGHTAGVQMGQHIGVETAERYLTEDLVWAEECVNKNVVAPLTQGQFDALVSFVFNVGAQAFKDSTLLRKLNARDYAGAAEEFLRWDKGTVNGVKVALPGLVTRRSIERKLFLAGNAAPVPPSGDPTQYSQEGGMPIPALVTALLPSVVSAIPELAKLFKPGSPVAERNVAAATTILDIVTKAVPGAANAQAAVEAIQTDPTARKAAADAVERQWYGIYKASEESTAAARDFSVRYAESHAVRTVMGHLTFLEVLSLLLVLSTLAGGMAVLIWGGIDAQLKGAVVTLMLIGGFTGVTNFWFGSSLGSKKKDDEAKVV